MSRGGGGSARSAAPPGPANGTAKTEAATTATTTSRRITHPLHHRYVRRSRQPSLAPTSVRHSCFRIGTTVPFRESQVHELYSSHQDFVAEWKGSDRSRCRGCAPRGSVLGRRAVHLDRRNHLLDLVDHEHGAGPEEHDGRIHLREG